MDNLNRLGSKSRPDQLASLVSRTNRIIYLGKPSIISLIRIQNRIRRKCVPNTVQGTVLRTEGIFCCIIRKAFLRGDQAFPVVAGSIHSRKELNTCRHHLWYFSSYLVDIRNDLLYGIRDGSPDIQYVYVYKIEEDGCHVVFDLDTEDELGADPGDIIAFDESFSEYIPALLRGESIPSVVSDDSYGWLLTAYIPVHNSQGQTVCYAAADISMAQLATESHSFLAKQVSLFAGFFILVMAVGLWLAEYGIIYPVNSMAYTAKAFAYDSEEVREENVDMIKKLDIHTGDEIENLYGAFTKTTADSMDYVHDIQTKTEMINKMQTGLIFVLADMVENRDKVTGDHIKKTSAYVELIGKKLKERGLYTDYVTDEYIEYLRDSAPLHDVGKITISDLILNKDGKLTDEEYAIMKGHTTAGRKVIEQVMEKVPDSQYLRMAANMANFHHERWDGKGYPEGRKGDEIPLSARIMTIADVFDALVSRRSYKKPFTFDQAMKMIEEGAGTQFDPVIAGIFIDSREDVKKIADDFYED